VRQRRLEYRNVVELDDARKLREVQRDVGADVLLLLSDSDVNELSRG